MSTDNSGNNDAGSNGQPEGSAAAGNESLDSILDGFDDKTNYAGGAKKVELSAEEVEDFRVFQTERQNNRVETVVGDISKVLLGDSELPDTIVRGWLEKQLMDNPELNKLISLRYSNKSQFDKAVKELLPGFQKHIEGIQVVKDVDNTNLRAGAIRQSRSTSQGSKDFGDVDLSELNDTDFAMKSREIIRAAEAGELS